MYSLVKANLQIGKDLPQNIDLFRLLRAESSIEQMQTIQKIQKMLFVG